jgi:hypothetical protein
VQPRSHRQQWVLLAYRIPREPSTPRIAVWRKLRRLGAAQLLDGLVALPLDSRNREALEWIADEVVDAQGEATLWIGALASAAQERELEARMTNTIVAEYQSVIAEAESLLVGEAPGSRRSLLRLRRELRRIRARDYFPVPEREEAMQAVEAFAAGMEEARK